MRLDYYLPAYNYCEKHKITIQSSPASVYRSIRAINLKNSKIIRILIKIRGASYGRKGMEKPLPGMSVDDLIKGHFTLLEEVENREIIMGFAGKFWRPAGGLANLSGPEDFLAFKSRGFCKSAWNFYIEENPAGGVNLSTETRVLCPGWRARVMFGCYWLVIRLFSGWIRIIMLKMIKEQAEIMR